MVGAFQAVHGITLELHAGWPWDWFHPRLVYLLNHENPFARAVLPAPKTK